MKESNIYILILSTFLLFGCSYNNGKECLQNLQIKVNNGLSENIQLNFKNELNCFEWDSLMFLERHFNSEDIEERTGININGLNTMGIKYLTKSDFYTHIIFLKEKSIVGVIETSKGILIDDFITELNNNDIAIIAAEDSDFTTYLTGGKYVNGENILSLTFTKPELIEKYKK